MAISFTDLDRLSGEVLPERTVLSTVSTPFNNGGGQGGDGGGSNASAAQTGGGSSAGHGATALNGSSSNVQHGTPGLLGSLGLGSNNPTETSGANPGSIASN